jgi:hypothetical protein
LNEDTVLSADAEADAEAEALGDELADAEAVASAPSVKNVRPNLASV